MGLLIAPADRFLQEFLASGEPADQKRAARWAASLKITSVLVLLLLVVLSIAGTHDAGLGLIGRFVTGFWLLLTPLLAQAGLAGLVWCLVKSVPQIVMLPLRQPPDCSASPGGIRFPTVICFLNETPFEMQVWWLDFRGQKDKRGPLLPALGNATQPTFQGHRFLVATTAEDLGIGTVEAATTPGQVVIERKHLQGPDLKGTD